MTRNFAIVGCGLIGRKRASAFTKLGCNLIGAYDLNPDVSVRFGTTFGCPSASSLDHLSDMLDEGGLVVVATTHNALTSTADFFSQRGHSILVEKPGASRLSDIEQLNASVERLGVTASVGFNHRFHPGIIAIRRAVIDQKLGRVISVRAVYGHGGRPGYQNEWRFKRDISGGGELLDQGSHLIDLTRYITGSNLNLEFAKLRNVFWGGEVEEAGTLILGSDDNSFDVTISASWTEWKNKFNLEVFCERGKLEVSGLGGSYGPETYREYDMGETIGPPEITSVEFQPQDLSWDLECGDFISRLEGSDSVGASLGDAIEVLKIVESAYAQ
ncbi:MAG: Gfo/Idh/MocA family oxidoreductase [Actinomycetota bacterium]|nr:Gfo/Idh/MocA family oxidoreductase [Actinomycetota bacterium]